MAAEWARDYADAARACVAQAEAMANGRRVVVRQGGRFRASEATADGEPLRGVMQHSLAAALPPVAPASVAVQRGCWR